MEPSPKSRLFFPKLFVFVFSMGASPKSLNIFYPKEFLLFPAWGIPKVYMVAMAMEAKMFLTCIVLWFDVSVNIASVS